MKFSHIFILIVIILISLMFAMTVESSISPSSSSISPYLNPYLNNTASAPNTTSFYVVISSSYPGQAQELTLPLNSTGYLMYPDWHFLFFSADGNTTYQIYINGELVASHTFVFKDSFSFNFQNNTNMVNVAIILSGKTNSTVFNFYNVPILHTTMASYFKGQPIELPAYTLTQYIELGLKATLASFLVSIGSYAIISKVYVAKKKMEVYRY